MFSIDVTDEQDSLVFDPQRLVQAARAILDEAQLSQAIVGIAVVDDATIHQLNRQFLEHDYPTDVLSFLLERTAHGLEGEIVISAETAARAAVEYDWTAQDELLLYAIHGTLHLVGYDDRTADDRAAMRLAEARHLAPFGLAPRDGETAGGEPAGD